MASEIRKISALRLVYPPFSNHDSYFLQEDPQIEDAMRGSDFYMIGARTELKFRNVSSSEESVNLTISSGRNSSRGKIDFGHLLKDTDISEVKISGNDQFLGFSDALSEDAVLQGFSPESLLFYRSRNHPAITGFLNRDKLTTYDLLYVGTLQLYPKNVWM